MSGHMQQESWFVKSGLHAYYFKRTREGTIFTSPPNWAFGQGREYRVSDAQETELAARLGGGYVICLIGLLLGLAAAVPVMRWLDGQPIAAYSVIACIMAVPLLLYIRSTRRAIRSVLADVPSTAAPRSHALKAATRLFLSFQDLLPTWALVVFTVVALGAIATALIEAATALSSGQLSKAMFPLLQIAAFSAMLVVDVVLLRARRSEQSAK
jgi:hypothetical protein